MAASFLKSVCGTGTWLTGVPKIKSGSRRIVVTVGYY